MRRKSSFCSDFSSTRIGKRPCSSGMRSDGFAVWKAPAAMKRIWSVFIGPYFVMTVEPSTIGRMSRCTPSRETSGPEPCPLTATLSISSRKTMPLFSAARMAASLTSSMSTSFAASSCWKSFRAAATETLRFFCFFGMRFAIMSCRLSPMLSRLEPANMPTIGLPESSISISMTSFSSSPFSRRFLTHSRPAAYFGSLFSSDDSFSSSSDPPKSLPKGFCDFFGCGTNTSRMRSSASSAALSCTFSMRSWRTMRTAVSARSRTMDSTSRPT